MDIRNFKSGYFRKQTAYQNFLPEFIDHPWEMSDAALGELLSRVDRRLGELNAAGKWVADMDFFLSMHVAKEATTSSMIEGTQTTIEEAVAPRDEVDPERRDDWMEVQNYIEAMQLAIRQLAKMPVCGRLLRDAHKVLLQGVRGKHKSPGEYRRSQNWLGPSLKHAAYVPPGHEEVPALMSDLEKFLNDRAIEIPPLVRIGIAHYQFETIHPFLDGNGRLGRLLISLYLVSEKILEKPTLYLSDFFERHRTEYYERLTRARERNDLEGWLKFFFMGVLETAERSIDTIERITELRTELEAKRLPKLGKRAKHGAQLLKVLYAHPVIDRERVETKLGISTSTASRLLDDFVRVKILRETTGFRRNRRYAFTEYLDLFR